MLKRWLTVVLAVLFLAVTLPLVTPAQVFAAGGEPNNTGCNGVGNPNSPCTGQGGQGGQGGNATGGNANSTNTNTNQNSNSNKNKNTNTNTNTNTNSNTNVNVNSLNQKQQIKDSGNSTVSVDNGTGDFPRQAPPAFAPGLVAAPETCMGAVAVGASSPFGGISFGTTYKSEDCELRMYSRSLMALSGLDVRYGLAAAAILTQSKSVQEAFRAVGLPIPTSKVADVSSTQSTGSGGGGVAAAILPSPSTNPDLVKCPGGPPVRAGNGEYFCRSN